MPGGDRTGPVGMGAMTGRRAGVCSGFATPGRGPGIGLGQGYRCCGGVRGWRHRFYSTGMPEPLRFGINAAPYQRAEPEMERQALRNQANALQSELESIRKRLGEIDPTPPTA